MGFGLVERWWSSIRQTVKSVGSTSWDQAWQVSPRRDRSLLVATVLAGAVIIWVLIVTLGTVVPAVTWLGYYAFWASIFGWLGRSRSIADAPGRDSGVQMMVARAQQSGWQIPRYQNWTRDAFRKAPAGHQPETGWVGRQLDGPAGVMVGAALILTVGIVNRRSPNATAPDWSIPMLVLKLAPVALGVPIWQRVHMHRKAQRLAFVEQIRRRPPDQFVSDKPLDRAVPLPVQASATGPSDRASGLRLEIWVQVIIGLAIALLFYLLPPLYR